MKYEVVEDEELPAQVADDGQEFLAMAAAKPADWLAFADFQLTYLGKTREASERRLVILRSGMESGVDVAEAFVHAAAGDHAAWDAGCEACPALWVPRLRASLLSKADAGACARRHHGAAPQPHGADRQIARPRVPGRG